VDVACVVAVHKTSVRQVAIIPSTRPRVRAANVQVVTYVALNVLAENICRMRPVLVRFLTLHCQTSRGYATTRSDIVQRATIVRASAVLSKVVQVVGHAERACQRHARIGLHTAKLLCAMLVGTDDVVGIVSLQSAFATMKVVAPVLHRAAGMQVGSATLGVATEVEVGRFLHVRRWARVGAASGLVDATDRFALGRVMALDVRQVHVAPVHRPERAGKVFARSEPIAAVTGAYIDASPLAALDLARVVLHDVAVRALVMCRTSFLLHTACQGV